MKTSLELDNFMNWAKRLANLLWRRETVLCLLAVTAVLLIFLGISRIPATSAITEHDTATSASSIKNILENPLNAPYKIATYMMTSISPSIIMLRAVSFVIFAMTCIALYNVLLHWHTKRAAVLTTIAFATNSIVLAISRLGTPLVALYGWFLFSSLLLWQLHSKSNKFVPILTLISLGMLLYTPGAPWFFTIMLVIYFKRYKYLFRDVRAKAVGIGAAVSLITLSPLMLSFIRDPEIIRQWLLLPDNLVWQDVPVSILQVPSAFLYKMPEMPLINIAELPVFDLVSGMLFLIGINAYRKKVSLDRTRLMYATALAGITIGALGQTLTAVIILLPFVFSVVAAGIEYLTDEWETVFPRNPFAKTFGSLLLMIVVFFGAYYHLTRFLVVWPQTPETKIVYDQPRIIER